MLTKTHHKANQLVQDWIKFIRSVLLSFVTGALVVTISFSMTALIFQGKLSPYFHYGFYIFLCTIVVLNLVLVIGSSYPGIVSGPQSASSIIIATGLSTLYEKYAYLDVNKDMYLLLLSYMFVTATLTGLVLFFAGRFKLGKLIRYVPYPVYGGVLAGTGYLVVKASISFMTGDSEMLNGVNGIFSMPILVKWCSGAIFAVILFIVSRSKKHLYLVPLFLFLSIPAFYTGLWVSGLTYETATRLGFVMKLEGFGPFSPINLYQDIQNIDFSFILQQKWRIISIAVISSIALLFNLSSLELIVKDDIDIDRELQLSGCGNMISGLCGGAVGYQMLAPSAFNHMLGVKSRVSNFIIIAIGLTILLGGTEVSRLFPVPLIGGYLMFIGVSLLYDYLYSSWAKRPSHDFFVVLSILSITIIFGLLEGIALGIVAAIFIFIINYSKIRTIKNIITGEFFRSNVERTHFEESVLKKEGKRIRAFVLSGYLFFGSAYSLYIKIKNYIHLLGKTQSGFIILDFKDVQGIDSSAINSFLKIKHLLVNENNYKLLFTRISPNFKKQLVKESVLTPTVGPMVFTDIDRGFEWCEEEIINHDSKILRQENNYLSVLKTIFEDSDQINKFKKYLVPKNCMPNELLIKKGETSEALYIVEKGQFSVLYNEEYKNTIRYRKIGCGSIVGELGFFTNSKRTASVIAEIEGKVYVLNTDNQKLMEVEAQDVALKFQKYILAILAKRLTKATQDFNSLFVDKTL